MKASFQIGTIAGIPLKIHATFLLIVFLVATTAGSMAGLAAGLAMVAFVFGSVILHEAGHALAARRYGVGTRDITLYPIGGVAMLERMPEDPRQEVVIALAGPLVSFALAAATLPFLRLFGDTPARAFLWELATVNLFLGLFNLVPALPMDGGRVLRGALALWKGRAEATRIAAALGKVFALGFIAAGLLVWKPWNPMLVAIGIFVYLGASSEADHEQLRRRIGGRRAGDVMVTDFRVLTPETQVGSAAQAAARLLQDDFPVVRGGFVVGIVSQRRLLRALADGHGDDPVAWHMEPVRRFASPETPLIELLQDYAGGGQETVPVVAAGRLVGLVVPQRILRGTVGLTAD